MTLTSWSWIVRVDQSVVNLKGTSSFMTIDQKPGFRVNINKFAKGAKFFGLKEFLLNNMATDPSMIHERLAYWMARNSPNSV